ncbi:MAG: hypothetical protein Q8Q09_23950 [Deltaproteobacteria bacterium]|nr:hypothetical protein [Deltaproteobacteria bacterium]
MIRTPLQIEILPRELQAIDGRWREVTEALRHVIARDLSYWESFSLTLPVSSFGDARTLVGLDELFRAPTSDELDSVARGPDHKLLRLSIAQRAQLREDGHFTVASQQFPSQNHRWVVSAVLQRGRRVLRERLRHATAFAIGQWTVSIRERLVGTRGLSLRAARDRATQGLCAIAGLWVGLIEERQAMAPYDVDTALAEARRAFVLDGFVRETEHRWRNSDGMVLNLALHDPEVRARLVPALDRLFAAHAREEQARLYEPICSDEEIEELSPGLGAAVVEHVRAHEIIASLTRETDAKISARHADAREALTRAHPTRSLIPAWREAQLAAQTEREDTADRAALPARILAALTAASLPCAGLVFERTLRFARERAPTLRSALEAPRAPRARFEWPRAIWRKSQWKITFHPATPDGSPAHYTLDRYDRREVDTSAAGWRLRNVGQRVVQAYNNGLHWLLAENLASGRLGLRALFSDAPFPRRWEVDSDTGALVPCGEVQTYRSRLRALWRSILASRAAFEARPDTGFIGKSVSRWVHRFVKYVVEGALGTAAIALGQPALTLANLALVTALTVSSMVWAPVAGALLYVFDLLLYDLHAPGPHGRALPLAQQVIRECGAGGVGQAALAVGLATVVHPLSGATALTATAGLCALRAAYDDAVRGTLIARLGRVPASDSVFARRVEGPGMSAEFYFQVRPSLVQLVLRARMETEELLVYQRKTRELITQPQRDLQRFTAQVLALFAASSAPAERASRRVDESTARHLEALDLALAPRFEALRSLTHIAEGARIRLTRADLDRALTACVADAATFYRERLLPRLEPLERQDLWRAHGLSPEDYDGLARDLLASTFSPGILSPLEDTDRSLRLQVNPIRVSDYTRSLDEAKGFREDLDSLHEPYRRPAHRVVAVAATSPATLFTGYDEGLAAGLHF